MTLDFLRFSHIQQKHVFFYNRGQSGQGQNGHFRFRERGLSSLLNKYIYLL